MNVVNLSGGDAEGYVRERVSAIISGALRPRRGTEEIAGGEMGSDETEETEEVGSDNGISGVDGDAGEGVSAGDEKFR